MILPDEIKNILAKLRDNGFQAYAVGGCVRDVLLEKKPKVLSKANVPKDWDVTTNALPEEIQKIFPDSFYANQFGTVGVKSGSEDEALKIIEITTYRSESGYSDFRHPDEVRFVKSLEEDLARRDFTVNALAFDGSEVVDYFGGQTDLKNRLLRAVGDADVRFREDALRMMRAARFSCELVFAIEERTYEAIVKNSALIQNIAKERVRDEFVKIINSKKADYGIELLRKLNLLKFIVPELLRGYKVDQSKHHIYDVYDHNLHSLAYAVKKNFGSDVRLAALFHDVGKPQAKRGEGREATFYGHEVVGARITKKILERLKFPRERIEKITLLVRFHLFYYNVGEVTESSVRRLLRNVGPENINELMELRFCDRIGSGVPKAEPYKLRHLKYLLEKVSRDPISVKMLKINGDEIMGILNMGPGHKIGFLLNVLLEEVLDDPNKNDKEYLEGRVLELSKLSDEELKELAKKAVQTKEKTQEEVEEESKGRYWVR